MLPLFLIEFHATAIYTILIRTIFEIVAKVWQSNYANANMGKLKGLLNAIIDWFTMKNVRHNRALKDLLQLSKSMEGFVVRYDLQKGSSDFKTVLENIGQMRIDATEMAYQTRIRIRRAKLIEGKDLPLLVEEVYNDLEELKRSLFTRMLSNNVLSQRVSKLDVALENLLTAISDIEYK